MEKILSLSPLPAEFIQKILNDNGITDINVINGNTMSSSEILDSVKDAHYVIGDFTFKNKITRDFAKAAINVKLIQQPSVGYQHIDVASCKKFGIKVANTAGANTISVAEHTIMTALSLLKKLIYSAATTLNGDWKQMEIISAELFGKKWGIVGMGRIGKALAERLINFGVSIFYFDPVRMDTNDEEKYSSQYVSFNDLIRKSDIISLHCPLTEETTKIINKYTITKMKETVLLINVARGEIVDEPALARAIREKKIGGAAIDVFSEEPISLDNPLLNCVDENLLITPHIAGVTSESKIRILEIAISNLIRVLKGEEPENVIS